MWTATNVLFLMYHCLYSLPKKHALEAEKRALEDPDNWEIVPQESVSAIFNPLEVKGSKSARSVTRGQF